MGYRNKECDAGRLSAFLVVCGIMVMVALVVSNFRQAAQAGRESRSGAVASEGEDMAQEER